MKIFVQATPGAKHERLRRVDAAHIVIAVREPAHDGLANAAVEKAIADYFGVPISCVLVVSGRTSRKKIVEISCG